MKAGHKTNIDKQTTTAWFYTMDARNYKSCVVCIN